MNNLLAQAIAKILEKVVDNKKIIITIETADKGEKKTNE